MYFLIALTLGRRCFECDRISLIRTASWTLSVGRTLLITSQHALTLQAGRTQAGARGGQVLDLCPSWEEFGNQDTDILGPIT